MGVERGDESPILQLLEKADVVGEQLFVPAAQVISGNRTYNERDIRMGWDLRVAGPPRAILWRDIHQMPVHVEHADSQRDTFGLEAIHELKILLVGIRACASANMAR